MPYKTKSGSHYHETYGCCGAMESCTTEGLAPCRICCGKGSKAESGPGASTEVVAGGTPVGASSAGEHGVARRPATADIAGTPSGPSPASDIARVTDSMPMSPSASVSAPEVSVSPEDLLRDMGTMQEPEESAFSRIPLLSSVGQLRVRGRVAGVQGDSYVVHVKDYEGSNRVNYKLSFSKPHALRRLPGQYVRIDWEDNYWDKGSYGFVRIDDDGKMDIDSVISFSDYDADRLKGVLRHAGMSDDDLRRTVDDALDGFGIGRVASPGKQARPAGSRKPATRRARRAPGARTFVDAVNAGDDFFLRLHSSGADVEDDKALAKAFDEAIRSGEVDVPESLRGAAWASVLDARERELGWD